MKKPLKIILIALTIIIAIYLIMFYNTRSVKKDFIKALEGKTDCSNKENNYLQEYYCINHGYNEIDTTKIKVQTVFTIHNFKKGKIYYKYSWQLFNHKGEEINASIGVLVTMDIKKINGKWKVTDIREPA